MKVFSFLLLLICQAAAFAPAHRLTASCVPSVTRLAASDLLEEWHAPIVDKNEADCVGAVGVPSVRAGALGLFGMSTSLFLMAGPALAEVDMDDIEIAELPPVWVPIVFAIAIIGGVGLLTGSLGDVMSDGASC